MLAATPYPAASHLVEGVASWLRYWLRHPTLLVYESLLFDVGPRGVRLPLPSWCPSAVLPALLLASTGRALLPILGNALATLATTLGTILGTTLGEIIVVPRLGLVPQLLNSPFVVPTPRTTVRTTSDSSIGALARAAHKWPRGTWAGRVARRGLSWAWKGRSGPRLRLPPLYPKTSPQISSLLGVMLDQGVVEPSSGPVFLSRPFLVPRKDRPEPRMVVDLSRLNKEIQCYRFRMLTL